MNRRVQPPSGMPAPETTTLPDGTAIALIPLAEEITDRHLRRHPDDIERYGELARAWGVHDTRHQLHWAALDALGRLDMAAQVRWLSGVLEARGYPLGNLASNLRTAAEVVDEQLGEPGGPLSARLEAAGDAVGAFRS